MSSTRIEQPYTDPLRIPGVKRFIIADGAAAFLDSIGAAAFVFIGRTRYPDPRGSATTSISNDQ